MILKTVTESATTFAQTNRFIGLERLLACVRLHLPTPLFAPLARGDDMAQVTAGCTSRST